MNIYSLVDFLKRERLGEKKTNFIFWNFKDQKNGK